MINKISKIIFGANIKLRDVRALEKSIKTGSITPIIKRLVNKWIGRNIVSKLWWR